jgi:riboflavin synthase
MYVSADRLSIRTSRKAEERRVFTGLIETRGHLRRLERRGPGIRLTIGADAGFVSKLELGESVSCDGACLTVVGASGDAFSVDASAETLGSTTLAKRRVGDSLHLERALALGARLGGHLVTGHIDGTGALEDKTPLGDSLRLVFKAPSQVARYLIPKGSIAIDGVSLTINHVDGMNFDVVLIPHTQSVVRLAEKKVGDEVNLEADLIGKYVEHLLSKHQRSAPPSQVSEALLREAGFVS